MATPDTPAGTYSLKTNVFLDGEIFDTRTTNITVSKPQEEDLDLGIGSNEPTTTPVVKKKKSKGIISSIIDFFVELFE